MPESQARIAVLQRRIARLVQSRPAGDSAADSGRVALGLAAIDGRIGGGLQRGALHEVVAAEAGDAAAGAGFAAMLARRVASEDGGALVWLRVQGQGAGLHPPGLNDVGIDPTGVLLVLARDPPDLLRAAGEVARCPAVGVAVIELWREPARIDLTVSRRLALAAEGSGATPILLRIAADPVPSAARTRWGVAAAPSIPLAADAPGGAAFAIELLRQRGGPAGWRWQVEWDRDRGMFSEGAAYRPRSGAPLPGDLAAVPDGGPLGPELDGGERRAAG